MMKNAVLLFLSEIHLSKGKYLSSTSYHAAPFADIKCIQTNEAAVKYLLQKLAGQQETLDYIFAFSTQKTKETISYVDDRTGQQLAAVQRDIFAGEVAKVCPELAKKIIYVDYDENCSAESIVLYVLKMVDEIRAILGTEDDSWRIHTDLTGGMRHAAVLMLSVLHMLKYSGIEIGQAIYANYFREDTSRNRIEDVSSIHRMFELVSSTDSCINFASMREVEKYFAAVPEREISKRLRDLLISMQEFSDAVKICRTGRFELSLKKLAANLQAFKNYQGKSAQEQLFAQVLETVERDYGDIIKAEPSRIDIIRWCVKKGFLQQAMTLFTEWMPGELVKRKLYYPSPVYDFEIRETCQKSDLGYKLFENVFVYDFCSTLEKLREKKENNKPNGITKNSLNMVRMYFQNNQTGPLPEYIDKKLWKSFMQEIKYVAAYQDQIRAGRLYIGDFISDHECLAMVLDGRKKGDGKRKEWQLYDYLMDYKLNAQTIYNYLTVVPGELLRDLLEKLSVFPEEPKPEQVPVIEVPTIPYYAYDYPNLIMSTGSFNWDDRKESICRMLTEGIVCTDTSDIENLLYVMEILSWLRKQRNEINHAYNGVDVASSEDVERYIMLALKKIEQLS